MSLADALRAGSRLPTFYSGYTEREQQNREQGSRELNQAVAAQGMLANFQKMQEERALRAALAETGGDLAKALPVVIQSGNLAGARNLASLLEEQRKTTEPRVMAPGSQLVGRDNQVLHSVPHAPQRPQAMPEIVNLRTIMDSLPEGHPFRADLQAKIKRLAHGEQSAPRPFGAGATGGSLEIMNRFARGYGAGVTTDTEDREFETAVTHYTQLRQYQNPDTGLLETRRPELPPFVQEALNSRRGARPAAIPTPSPGSRDPQPAPAPAPRAQTDQTAWGLASLTTGPVPAAAETLSRTPLLGEVVRAPQFTQARNFVPMLQRDLIRVLQNSPRYAEGERRAIERETSIEGRLFDNPSSYRDRLVGIDRALQIRERNAFETSTSARVGREERIHAMNVLNALTKFRQNLGVPPTIRGDQDWQALPPGTEYIDPDGNVRRKQ